MKLRITLAAALFALGLVACNKVDSDDMANKIKDKMTEQLAAVAGAKVKVKHVDCPSGQSMKEGTKFDCNVEFDTGQKMPAHIEMQADGKFVWHFDADDLATLPK